MIVSFSGVPSASSIFATYASLSALIMLFNTILNQLVPHQLQNYVLSKIQDYFRPRSSDACIVIEEVEGMSINEVFDAAETYLCTKTRPNIERLKISKRWKDAGVSIKFAQCEKIADVFEGVNLHWMFVSEDRKKCSKGGHDFDDNALPDLERRYFELRFDKKYKELVLDSYIPYVLQTAKEIRNENRVVKLHTLACAASYTSSLLWDSVNLDHPSTFDTLAMDSDKKQALIDDLDRFLMRKDFYRKVGRAWKRGYLLYGPPGTGKSSLIAAMANHLKFDIYDLELTNIKRDSDLRKLLLRTANRSILVIEDIDCSAEYLPDRKGPAAAVDGRGNAKCDLQFTLSGLLNFVDGLWSSCGDERIIVFTTNNRDKLDPALLRPGRMDVHVHMSYLAPEGFKVLASTYLDVHDEGHPSFAEIEGLFQSMNVSPAEVAEELMKSTDPHAALTSLIHFLRSRKEEISNRVLEDEKNVADEDDDLQVGK